MKYRTNEDREREVRFDAERAIPKPTSRLERLKARARRQQYPDISIAPTETPLTTPASPSPSNKTRTSTITSPGAATPKTMLLKESRGISKLSPLVLTPEGGNDNLPARLPRSRHEALRLNEILDTLSAQCRAQLLGYDTCIATLLGSSASPTSALLAQQVAARASRHAGSEQEALTEALDMILADLIRSASKKSSRVGDLYQQQLRAAEDDHALRVSALQEEHAAEVAALRSRVAALEAALASK